MATKLWIITSNLRSDDMRVVGKQQRDEFILDIDEAMRCGALLDNMLLLGGIPRASGVRRITQEQMNAEDEARSMQMARLVNQSCS